MHKHTEIQLELLRNLKWWRLAIGIALLLATFIYIASGTNHRAFPIMGECCGSPSLFTALNPDYINSIGDNDSSLLVRGSPFKRIGRFNDGFRSNRLNTTSPASPRFVPRGPFVVPKMRPEDKYVLDKESA